MAGPAWPGLAVTDPAPVRDVENVFIPVAGGIRLAARLWLPEGAERRPVPAILEYISYRKRDFTRRGDALMHPYFAARGYASLRIDLQGSGDSDGLMHDEYLQQEQDDAVEAIAWIAGQPWCTGKVGMLGGSWGGFNSLQVAARRPPALAAIITVVSTDDRYADDMHFMGGSLLTDTMSWGTQFFAQTGRPPDPAVVGDRWWAMWQDRLQAMAPMVATWLQHQRRDAFWKHGSVCEDWDAIRCPVYAIGGWADGYSNAVFRLLAGLRVPRKGLVGPWGHGRPHFALPGPRIGYLQECLRWWDHWLRGRPTGIMDEPMLRVWMQESVPPRAFYEERPGRWVSEAGWPSPRLAPRRYCLGQGRLGAGAGPGWLAVSSPQAVGVAGGEWCPFGLGGVGAEMPLDQRLDDGGSLVFDSEPLAEPLEILGAPVVELQAAADRPVAVLTARLSDVAPGGAATRVTFGVLNLTHRDGHEAPVPLEPGRAYPIRLALNDIAHAFPAGHRIRLALSTAYWPMVWPAPEPVTVTVTMAGSALTLPIRPPAPPTPG
jgi:putative CocE/NonD family hydrolase